MTPAEPSSCEGLGQRELLRLPTPPPPPTRAPKWPVVFGVGALFLVGELETKRESPWIFGSGLTKRQSPRQ